MVDHFSKGLNLFLEKMHLKKGKEFCEIMMKWNQIVGEDFAKMVSPLGVFKIKKSGVIYRVLNANIKDSCYKTEISFKKDMIIELINTYLGKKYINKINFKVLPKKSK